MGVSSIVFISPTNFISTPGTASWCVGDDLPLDGDDGTRDKERQGVLAFLLLNLAKGTTESVDAVSLIISTEIGCLVVWCGRCRGE